MSGSEFFIREGMSKESLLADLEQMLSAEPKVAEEESVSYVVEAQSKFVPMANIARVDPRVQKPSSLFLNPKAAPGLRRQPGDTRSNKGVLRGRTALKDGSFASKLPPGIKIKTSTRSGSLAHRIEGRVKGSKASWQKDIDLIKILLDDSRDTSREHNGINMEKLVAKNTKKKGLFYKL